MISKECRPLLVAQVSTQAGMPSRNVRLRTPPFLLEALDLASGLPLILAGRLMKDVVLSVDVEDTVLHCALPDSGSVYFATAFL